MPPFAPVSVLWPPGEEPAGSTARARRASAGAIRIDGGALFEPSPPQFAGLDGGSLFSGTPDQRAWFDAGRIDA